ncbi:UDP-glucuronosyl/UDP-glucosyltransferase, partial [Parasponia andersonii]
ATTPMLQLGSILHSKGFEITVAHTKLNPPNPTHYPDFNFLKKPDGVSDPHIHSKNFVSVISGFSINCKPPLQAALAQMMGREDHHEKIACTIYDE